MAILRLVSISDKVVLSKRGQEKVPDASCRGFGCPGRIAMRPYAAAHQGVQRGFAPLRFFPFPQDWGTKGAELDDAMTVQQNAAGGFGVSPKSSPQSPHDWGAEKRSLSDGSLRVSL